MDVPPPILTRAYQEIGAGMAQFHNAQMISMWPFPFPYAQLSLFLSAPGPAELSSVGVVTKALPEKPFVSIARTCSALELRPPKFWELSPTARWLLGAVPISLLCGCPTVESSTAFKPKTSPQRCSCTERCSRCSSQGHGGSDLARLRCPL